jgi:hypothetical protein
MMYIFVSGFDQLLFSLYFEFLFEFEFEMTYDANDDWSLLIMMTWHNQEGDYCS